MSNHINWDAEADVVCVGAGIGGLSAAIAAHVFGSKPVVLEASDQVGGVTAWSFGEIWIANNHVARDLGVTDSAEQAFQYMKRLGMGFADEQRIRCQVENGAVALKFFESNAGLRCDLIRNFADYYHDFEGGLQEGRYLEPRPFAGKSLGSWQSKTRLSPYVPHGLTHEDMFQGGGMCSFLSWDFALMSKRLENDERCLGPGLAAYFVKGALDRDIPLITETRVDRLLTDGDRVIGVAATRGGREFHVKAGKGVVLATSAYGDDDYERLLGMRLDVRPILMSSVTGAHFKLAGRLGAKIARVPDCGFLGYQIPGEELEGRPMWRVGFSDGGVPHAMVVNSAGRRFGNESFYRGLAFAVDYIDGSTMTRPNFPCWIVLDSQCRGKYPLGSVLPGQDLHPDLAVKADTLEELARKAGIDANNLVNEVMKFNQYCEAGVDPDFHRGESPWARFMCGDLNNKPNANLGAVRVGPFYAVRLSRISDMGMGVAGIVTDLDSRVVNQDSDPIPGLYAAGNCVARLDSGAGMQSGFSNARGMTHGYLAAKHLTAGTKTQISHG